eukprot:343690-Lingulodinium_polyedra.AAC.1
MADGCRRGGLNLKCDNLATQIQKHPPHANPQVDAGHPNKCTANASVGRTSATPPHRAGNWTAAR